MPTPTQTFSDTLAKTPPLANALQTNLQRLKDDNARIITVLTYSKTVADNLDKLDDTLGTVIDLLTVVSVVPEVGQVASALKNTLTVLRSQVSPARKAADAIEAKVKPVREALQKIDSGLDQAISLCGKISSGAQTFLTAFTAVNQCINGLPDGEYKQKGLQYLDQFSSAATPVVSGLNTALSTMNDAINTFYTKLKQLQNALSPLQSLAAAVLRVQSVLNPVLGPLQSLKNALMNIEIPIPVPYPHNVKLYDVFTTFGQFIDLAMKPIQDLVNQLLSALRIQIPQIPGLGDLIRLVVDVPGVPDLTALQQAINNPFGTLQTLIGKFNLKCPPSKGDLPPIFKA